MNKIAETVKKIETGGSRHGSHCHGWLAEGPPIVTCLGLYRLFQ